MKQSVPLSQTKKRRKPPHFFAALFPDVRAIFFRCYFFLFISVVFVQRKKKKKKKERNAFCDREWGKKRCSANGQTRCMVGQMVKRKETPSLVFSDKQREKEREREHNPTPPHPRARRTSHNTQKNTNLKTEKYSTLPPSPHSFHFFSFSKPLRLRLFFLLPTQHFVPPPYFASQQHFPIAGYFRRFSALQNAAFSPFFPFPFPPMQDA